MHDNYRIFYPTCDYMCIDVTLQVALNKVNKLEQCHIAAKYNYSNWIDRDIF